LIPSITAWKKISLQGPANGAVVATAQTTADGAIEGGSIKTTSAGGTIFLSQSVFQLPKTGKWWLSWKGILGGGGASGHDSQFGIANSGAGHSWTMRRKNAVSATNYTIQMTGTSSVISGAGAIPADNNEHVYRVCFDGTTFSSYVDNQFDNSLTTISQMADEPMYVFMSSGTAGEAIVQDMLIGFIG